MCERVHYVCMRTKPEHPRRVDQPEPGFFRLTFCRDGWLVPARIVHDDGLWHAVVDGVAHSAHADPLFAPWVFRLWQGAERADEADYRWRLKLRAWAAEHAPTHPCLRPETPMYRLIAPPIIPHTEDTIP